MSDQLTSTPGLHEDRTDVKDFQIVVNAQMASVKSEVVTYEQVVAIAFPHPPSPDATFSVTFRKAKHREKGSLVAGGSVEIKRKGTTFDVAHTGKS